MKLRNYTSNVAIDRSLVAIEKLLVEAGANHFSKFYDENKELVGVLFQLPINGIPQTFQLPAKPKAAEKKMLAEIKKPHRGTVARVREQAGRTAWKLLHDWVHIQVTMILMEQADAIQVFLPYHFDQRTQQTFFEKIKGNGFKQLSAARNDTW